MWLATIGPAVFLVPYILAVAMPSWHWLLACSTLGAGFLAYWLFEIVTSQYEYGERGISYLLLLGLAVPFGSGALIRSASLIMAARGYSRRSVLAVHVAGLALPTGIVAMAAALSA